MLAAAIKASAAHPARTHQGFERVGVTETHRRKQRHSRLTQPQFLVILTVSYQTIGAQKKERDMQIEIEYCGM